MYEGNEMKEDKELNENKEIIDLIARIRENDSEAKLELFMEYEDFITEKLLDYTRKHYSNLRVSSSAENLSLDKQKNLAEDMARNVAFEFLDNFFFKSNKLDKYLKKYDPKETKLISYIMKSAKNYLIDHMDKHDNIEVKRDKDKKTTKKIKVSQLSINSKINTNNTDDNGTELIERTVLLNNYLPDPENEGIKRSLLQVCTDEVNLTNLDDNEFMNIIGGLIHECLEEELYKRFKTTVDSGFKYVYYIEIYLMSLVGFKKGEILNHIEDKDVSINEGNFDQRKHEGRKLIEKVCQEFRNRASECCNAIFEYEDVEFINIFMIKMAEWLIEFQNNQEKQERVKEKVYLWGKTKF